MEKSATLNLRINPTLKSEAETVLSRLGTENAAEAFKKFRETHR